MSVTEQPGHGHQPPAAPVGAQPRGARPTIEVRSIDYVPRAERHGKVWHQGPFWFTGNFVLVTMVTGFTGPALGLSLGWAVLAILLGVAFGTFFMAFHANQGPRMGLPQMIQSRAQFGMRGSIVPFLAVVFVYVGFSVFDVILATDALQTVLPGGELFWYPLLILISVGIAIVGHDLLHTVQRWLTYVLIAAFAVLSIGALATLDIGSTVPDGGLSWGAFLVQFSAAAGYQISYSVYVSDYSRYLPEKVSAKKVIAWTYVGAAGSAAWLMSLGALIGSSIETPDAITSVRAVGDQVFDGLGTAIILISVPALIGIMAVNIYGAMLTSASGLDAFRPVRATVKVRLLGIAAIALIVFVVALAIPESYLDSFNDFVLLMLYFLVPWTAVNLVDFYFVRRGHYAITEIFKPRGIYGLWSWRGLVAYVAGLASMVPFAATSFYTSPGSKALSGADVSFAVGLLVSGLLYWTLNRNLDLGNEQAAIERSERELEPASANAIP